MFSVSQLAKFGKVTVKRIAEFVAADCDLELATDQAISMERLCSNCANVEFEKEKQLSGLKEQIAEEGLRKASRQLGVDPSNLQRRLRS